MKKLKRIFALIGVILLVGLPITTFVAALCESVFAHQLFLASLFSTMVVPIMLYAYALVYKVVKGKQNKSVSDNQQTQNK